MEIQWGKNPEYTFHYFHHWTKWCLPFEISWNRYDGGAGVNNSWSVRFLCFGIMFEIWRYKEEPNKLTQETFEKSKCGEDLHKCSSIDELMKDLNDEN